MAKPRATSVGFQDTLLREMVGTWNVAQRIWTGPNVEPITPPPAVARRRLAGDRFLEEVMEAAPGSGQEPFTRIVYLNYNKVTQRYESISMDTRAPQIWTPLVGERAMEFLAGEYVYTRQGPR